MRVEVGILTMARYLREGVGKNVRCFVNTKYGLEEFSSVRGFPGYLQVILKARRKGWGIAQTRIQANLNTEIFLAKRDLTGFARVDVLEIAERAASIDALTISA